VTAIDGDTVRAGLVSLPYAVRGSAYGKYTILGRRFKIKTGTLTLFWVKESLRMSHKDNNASISVSLLRVAVIGFTIQGDVDILVLPP
jgi:hypothetical protein